MTDQILYRVEDRLAYVVFNRPAARNAFTYEMYEALADACARVNADSSLKAMILTGAGDKAFAAGTDIAQFQSMATAQDVIGYEERIERVLQALEQCRVPTIAAVSGVCTGGGGMIAACCDLRIATADAQFGFPIARTLGNCLSLANHARLVALIGAARVKDLVFRARLVGAKEAHAIGLWNEIVDDAADLMTRAHTIAAEIAAHAPLTLRATKQTLLRLRSATLPHDPHDLVLMCYLSADFREGMAAFLEKRAPTWRGI
jgi:enoyl-CoA hydratase/carnithine racemase